ncbi:MAG: prepilin-type N-terminal cleavage/methylation domain-containing protein [Sterolibacteriaceae bacterium]|jgi:prepilin-type N-terminal cleavage/methylation domain-containing protein|nr:prepilin-type N-terminal cleavage/methylation domain-containing protein [Candidatus Methylophosphatis haderslevensis]
MPNRQSGFTLVEIAIVLVIIGLLLGGVLKGQELINSAKVKNFAQDFRSVPLFIYGYQDKFKALPGDDAKAQEHLGSTAPVVSGAGNGAINGYWNDNFSATPTETVVFWDHVRRANLASGPYPITKDSDLPTNADGGRIGVQSAKPVSDMTGSYYVCSAAIQGKFAKQLDITMDDGHTTSGSMRVGTWASNALTPVAESGTGTIIDDGQPYVVCLGF